MKIFSSSKLCILRKRKVFCDKSRYFTLQKLSSWNSESIFSRESEEFYYFIKLALPWAASTWIWNSCPYLKTSICWVEGLIIKLRFSRLLGEATCIVGTLSVFPPFENGWIFDWLVKFLLGVGERDNLLPDIEGWEHNDTSLVVIL